jgi:hypothetical protein
MDNVIEQNVTAIKVRIEQMEYELKALKATLMLSDFDMREHGCKMTDDEIEAMHFIQEYTIKKKVAFEEQIAMEKEKLLVWEGFQTSSGSGCG